MSETNIFIYYNADFPVKSNLVLMVTEDFHNRTNSKQVQFQYNRKDLLQHRNAQDA